MTDTIDIEALRQAAINAGKCISETTLKRDYRMKLNADAVPVTFYKNRYGQEFPVYRITDCTPMHDKPPRTQAQVEAGKKLAALARQNSRQGRAAALAHKWLNLENALVLDTETTGLDAADQVIEIAVIDKNGLVLLDTRLRPSVPINPEAQGIHGISAERLVDAPNWLDIAPRLRQVLEGRQVIAFNADFDSRLLQQTAQAYGDDYWAWKVVEHCAMGIAASAFREWSPRRNGRISLRSAVSAAGIEWQGEAHSALGDALTTLELVKAIAEL